MPSQPLVLAPFRAVRYAPAVVGDLAAVTSPPYDVIDADDVTALEVSTPYNVVRLILPRPGAGPGTSRYTHAAQTLRTWLAEGALQRDDEPALYVYEQSSPSGARRGLLGALALRDPADGVVLPHEDVMPGPVADRHDLMSATRANLEPILLVHTPAPGARAVVDAVAEGPLAPVLDVVTGDGHRHRLWAVRDPSRLAAVAESLADAQALIADGHHRYATYLRLRDEHATGSDPGAWGYGLALLLDEQSAPLQVAAIHRSVTPVDAADALSRAGVAFTVTRVDDDPGAAMAALRAAGGATALLLVCGADGNHLLTDPDPTALDAAVPPGHSPAYRGLDATVLHSLLLDRVWGVPESAIGYHHDVAAAIRTAERGRGIAVLLNPVGVATVREVAAGGERMPRKSTSFGPKPRTGLLLRLVDDDATGGTVIPDGPA